MEHARTIFGCACPFLNHERTNTHHMANSTLRKRSVRRPTTVNAQVGPRKATINAILHFSKALRVVEVPPVGEVAVVLN